MVSEVNFIRIEEDVRRFWQRHTVPSEASILRQNGARYLIHQQPLAVVDQVSSDQVRLLCTADLLARFQAMQGAAVHVPVGWACHGLSVEVAAERVLRPDKPAYDIEPFNEACRNLAVDGIHQGEARAERLAVWLRAEQTYATLMPWVVSSVWGLVRKLWDMQKLAQQDRIVPFCPRCATPLSDVEAGRRTAESESVSIYLQLPWAGEPNTYFLVRTPIPWMLAGMVALAVHPETSFALVELPSENEQPPMRLLVAEEALDDTLLEDCDYAVVRKMQGKALRDSHYHPPFTFVPAREESDRIVLSTGIPPNKVTGFHPVSPSFDAASLALAQAQDLLVPELLDDWGRFGTSVMPWRGLTPYDAEPFLVEDLEERGLVFRKDSALRPSQACPYCDTPLLPLARSVWLVPAASGPWTISRNRTWGTPLPIWECGTCGEQTCVASLDDLAHRTGLNPKQIDPHRPHVDGLIFPCAKCGGTMRRIPEVLDSAFEAAALPRSLGPRADVPDLVVGLGETDTEWLEDTGEVAALLGDPPTTGRTLVPPAENEALAWDPVGPSSGDALRWAVFAGTSPEAAERDFLRPAWRLVSTLVSEKGGQDQKPQLGTGQALLHRWLMARLHQTIHTVTRNLDLHEVPPATAALAGFVDDMSTWYLAHHVGDDEAILTTLSQMMAPFAPHLAEAIHREVHGREAQSVHLAPWPTSDPGWEDAALLDQMALVRRLAALGQQARTQAGIEPRRVLRRGLITFLDADASKTQSLALFRDLLEEVLSVGKVEFSPDAGGKVEWNLALREERAITRSLPHEEIAAALAGLDLSDTRNVASQLWKGMSVSVRVADQEVTLLPDEFSLSIQAKRGWMAAQAGSLLVLLQNK